MSSVKYSGYKWLGDIPSNWEVLKVKDGFTRKKAKALISDPVVLSLARSGVKIRDISSNEGQLAASYYEYNPVSVNDMLLNPMDLISGANCSISKVEGVISPAYVNLKAKKGFDPEFYDYYFKHQYWSFAFFAHGKGVSFDNRWTLNEDALMNFPLITPPYDVQLQIAAALNNKCGLVDSIIDDLNLQIEALENMKTSIITEVVIGGLSESKNFKSTGIKWFGKIPANWDVKPFKYMLNERFESNNPIKTNERLSLSIGKGVTLYSEKTTNLDRFKEDVSKYKIAHEGDLVINSMNVIVGAIGVSAYFGCVSPAYYVFYDNVPNHVTSRFCNYLFLAKPMRKILYSMGKGILAFDKGNDNINTCRLKVSRYDIQHLQFPCPPLGEQKQIVDYLDKKTSEIDSIIGDKEKQITELEMYKRSLIYEYVTGKKEVPNE